MLPYRSGTEHLVFLSGPVYDVPMLRKSPSKTHNVFHPQHHQFSAIAVNSLTHAMSENAHKKRKRSTKDTGDEAPPRKSRVVGNEDESARTVHEEDNVQPAALLAKPVKDGKSRQDKSERRSKK